MNSDIERMARFMGFRVCPACGETLFAAERATFVSDGRIILYWRCDVCDHRFESEPVAIKRLPATAK